jgi:hypothetical protein
VHTLKVAAPLDAEKRDHGLATMNRSHSQDMVTKSGSGRFLSGTYPIVVTQQIMMSESDYLLFFAYSPTGVVAPHSQIQGN